MEILTEDHVEHAQKIISDIPTILQNLAHDPEKVELVFYALQLASNQATLPEKSQILEKLIATDLSSQVTEYAKQLAQASDRITLPLIDIGLPAFKKNTPEKRQAIYRIMQSLNSLNEENLSQFCIMAMVGKNIIDKTPAENKAKYQDFSPVLSDISALMAFLTSAGGTDANINDALYDKIMKVFTTKSIPQPALKDFEPIKFQLVLSRLNFLSPACKEKLIHACLDCIGDDNVITAKEAELVRAIASCLDCPIPPILPTTGSINR